MAETKEASTPPIFDLVECPIGDFFRQFADLCDGNGFFGEEQGKKLMDIIRSCKSYAWQNWGQLLPRKK